ncbi:protein 60A-like [Contarinia nasturtii]|uniref:protein 60A-like n=1 Tax=Contarinia nasturtii TaxID=265458 RepID=UPI0012D4449F|nr:protein 60A-like [Contarinia nasturtii]XP_031632691.1 protein 60A-like [Contarinia nasturtii]
MDFKCWIFVWTIICCRPHFEGAVFGFSGFYEDNGVDQTIYESTMARDDIHKIREHILEMVGLNNRPYPEGNYNKTNLPYKKSHKSVPKFLWKIYKHLNEDENTQILQNDIRQNSMNGNDEITDEHAQIIKKSDTIMTFLNNRDAFPNPKNETRLTFDLSEVSLDGITLLMSEFHLYKRPLPEKHLASKPCLITVYATTVVDGAKELHVIQTAKTTVGFDGWIQMNFTTKLSEWITKKESSNLLYIRIEYEDEMGHWETPSISTNFLLCYSDNELQPFITAYFESENPDGHVLKHSSLKKVPAPSTNRRSKRDTQQTSTKKPKKQRRLQDDAKSLRLNQLLNADIKPDKTYRSCSRHALYISFKQLSWDDWIFAPAGYGAYYCAGTCNFPFQHDTEVTIHAIVQEVAHLLQDHRIPKPCCAPSKLQPLSLLYMQNETSASIKKHKGMIATKCACQ